MLRSTQLFKPALLVAGLLFVVGCAPIELDLDTLPTATPAATEVATPAPLEESPAVEAAMVTVTTADLVLRRMPDETSPALGELEQWQEYKVIGISTDGTWVRIEVLDAPTGAGWVTARFVTVEGDITEVPITDGTGVATVRPDAPADGAVVLTDGTRLRVREEPTDDSEILTYAYDGEIYNVLETTANGAWTKINAVGTEDGGWVATEFLELGEEVIVGISSTATLPITDTVALTSTVALTDTVSETSSTATTSTITSTGPVSATDEVSATTATTDTAITDTTTPDAATTDLADPQSGEAIINTGGQRLRIRSAPDEDAEIIGYAADGDIYNVVELSTDGAWARLSVIEFEDDGWVSSQFLEFGGAVNGGPLTVGQVVTETDTISETDVATVPITEPITQTETATQTEAVTETEATTESETEAAPAAENSPETDVITATAPVALEDLPVPGPNEAVVYTDGTRLRVRSEPNTESDDNIVGYIYTGEVYTILDVSDDGLWVQLDIEGIEGGGWVYDIYVLTAQ